MSEIKPDRNYFVGWYYALKWKLENRKDKRKIMKLVWEKKLKQKYFWYTYNQWCKQVDENMKRLKELRDNLPIIEWNREDDYIDHYKNYYVEDIS